MWNDFILTLPEEIIGLGALVLMIAAAWTGDRGAAVLTWLSVLVLGIAAAFLPGLVDDGGAAFGGQFVADRFAAFAKIVTYLAAIVAMLAAMTWFGRDRDYRAEYPVLILFAVLGMGIMISAHDLLTLYVGLELQSLAAYVLASFQRSDARSSEAGLKYFVLGALASGILLYGISLLYGFTGTTGFDGVARALAADGVSTGELFGIVFVLAGLAFKVSAVPFHMWTPDVYEGAPTPVTAFFASAPKVAAMALLVRVTVDSMGPATDEWRQIVIFAALASTVLGGVAAIGQKNIKRLLAYSSINNVGFALVGLAAGTPQGVASVLFYMAVYVAMTLGAFLVVLRMRDANGEPVEAIASLAGLSQTRPWLALGMAMFMFSLAGIPPFLGFFSKLFVFNAAVQANLTWLAVIAIVTSVIGAFYYIMIVKMMYFDEPAPAYSDVREPATAGLMLASAAFVSPLGWFALGALNAATLNAANSLF
ncbi:NADH-quinone oxidoreductase subunit NuoN [Sphingosinicella sp.]|uniref:NADH-quinone oxidoreductase subunit NuoN n=1 Tax=Sphingosinicella sp. TaxID=1917971 RepID=UPI0040382DF8